MKTDTKINKEKFIDLLLKKAVFSSSQEVAIKKAELIKLFGYNAKDLPPIGMDFMLDGLKKSGILEYYVIAVNKKPYYIKLTEKWFMSNLFNKTPKGVYGAILHCGGEATRTQIAEKCGYIPESTGMQNVISILQNRGLVERIYDERGRLVSYKISKNID